MSSVETTSEAYVQFENWLNEQPFWLQDATWRMYNGKKIDDEQIKIYTEMCIVQAKGKNPAYNHLASGELTCSKRDRKISVLSLSEIRGVNALADNVSLEFGEQGITAIYGLNGAGKSGFMRIFKQLSGCPYEEPIQPNVFNKVGTVAPSSCKVMVSQEGEHKEKVYCLKSRPEASLLSVCDVFDTRISNAYIIATNNVSYQPFVFTVLAELAPIADKISRRIATLKDAVFERSVQLPNDLALSAYLEWVVNISKDTEIPTEYLKWDAQQEKEISELLVLLDGEKVKQQLIVAETAKNALTPVFYDLQAAIASYNKDTFDAAYQNLSAAKKRFETAQLLFTESADEQDKISIDSDDWKALWDSAKKYYETILLTENGAHFGEKGSICPLCHQTITDEVHKRVSSVNQYINGSCSSEYQMAQEVFKRLWLALTKRHLTAVAVKTSLVGILPEDDLSSVTSVYDAIETISMINDEVQRYMAIGKIPLTQAIEIVDAKIKNLETEIKTLNDALKDDEKSKLQSRLEQLKSQKWVFDNQDTIRRVIGNLFRIAELENTRQYLTTNKITMQSNKLADSLITQAYIERFTKELALLAPRIKVKLEKAPSQKGNSPYKVTIDTDNGKKYKPEDILSEGEQRIVALAAFFADATGREDATPIIIDDPISSLDLNFEESATKRIVEIAKTRQVIVFTHRISLLVGIGEACEANGVPIKETHIRSAVKGKGIPDFADTYHGKVKSQLGGLKDKLIQVKKKDVDSEDYRDCIGRICQQFRICVERSVEDVLLLGIVRRFHKNIRTNNMVTKLPAIEEKDCKIVDEMMTKYSFIEHSQPSDALPLQYTVDEIEKDISAFIDWIIEYNKRQGNN
ncbi:MAG TPA: AAA family ATPase [Eubacteriales bacterium]|mgnify:CR=1 FL=1|nr:AAA family ATPase [Eubacteriales bacterium]